MAEPVVVVIFDFDGTLAPDSTTYLLKKVANFSYEDLNTFWANITKMVEGGWDPPLAIMNKILQLVKTSEMALTKGRLRELGYELNPFKGLPEMFDELKEMVKGNPQFSDAGITLEFYVISGGLEEVIRGNAIAEHMTGIFGCTFEHDDKTGKPIAIKSAVSFTEKTRFLFGIHKGFSERELRTTPYVVNDAIEQEKRKVPLRNMIYIGDGPSDIPCLSVVKDGGGNTIGIRKSGRKGEISKGYEMARGERITQGPYKADYSKGSEMRVAIEDSILDIAYDIVVKRKERRIVGPRAS